MKMACAGSHFPVIIHEDTKDDNERNITFSWNLNLLPDEEKTNRIEMVVEDDFVANGIPRFSLMEPKTIPGKMRMVNNYQVKGQGIC
jgi:hypothetical protein